MKFTITALKKTIEDPLKTFKSYERLVAAVCISLPAILRLFDRDALYPAGVNSGGNPIEKDWLGFRLCISDYVYSSNAQLFGMLLCMAAMLFIFNGAVYYRSQKQLRVNSKGKWYNVILGVALLGVICTPFRDYSNIHLGFAILFFFGNAAVIIAFHRKKNRIKSIVMGILTAVFLIMPKLHVNHFTLFWGEWCSLTVIGIHMILESTEVDYC